MAETGRLGQLGESVLSRVATSERDVVVALSGGADSAVCAWALLEKGVAVRAVHIDHGWEHSPQMYAAAKEVAGRLGVDLDTISIEAPSTEGGARRLRYQALSEAVEPDEILATGHTADDQVETVLAYVLRGTGPEGLTGIPRERPGVIRPIIEVWRSETRELAELAEIPFADDPTNTDRGIRNDIRNRLIPQLEEEYSPTVRRSLLRMSRLVSDEHEVIAARARSVPVHIEEGTAAIPVAALRVVERAVASEVIRSVCRRLNPPYAPDADGVDRVLSVVAGDAKGAEVEGGLTVRIERGMLLVSVDHPGR